MHRRRCPCCVYGERGSAATGAKGRSTPCRQNGWRSLSVGLLLLVFIEVERSSTERRLVIQTVPLLPQPVLVNRCRGTQGVAGSARCLDEVAVQFDEQVREGGGPIRLV